MIKNNKLIKSLMYFIFFFLYSYIKTKIINFIEKNLKAKPDYAYLGQIITFAHALDMIDRMEVMRSFDIFERLILYRLI